MVSNKNIFCVSNPAKILDGLWRIINDSGIDLTDMLIFLPNRRAVRSVEKMIVDKVGHATLLPRLVPLGEGVEDVDSDDEKFGTVSTLERVVATAYLLASIPTIKNISNALPVARTLITMQDYLENSSVDIADIDWTTLVDDKYAKHFQDKAQILSVLSRVQNEIFGGRDTETKRRNSDVYAWCDYVKNMDANKSLVVVCGSTASVPVTRDLMSVIASLPNGRIILPGRISGQKEDFKLDTNPYNSEYKFLSAIGVDVSDVQEIDVGASHIDFMNTAFSNVYSDLNDCDLSNCHLIEAARESEEAAVVAEITARAIRDKKTVLIITPDAAGNQRLKTEFERRNIDADFSGGLSGTMTAAGRAILNLFDDWIENGTNYFEEIYSRNNFNLFDTVAEIVDKYDESFAPQFDVENPESVVVWTAIKKLSDCLMGKSIQVSLTDARAFIADAIGGVRVRPPMNDATNVCVLGTIESRMQTADVVILTGLNEGMFPATGYENPWLPRQISNQIGLPSPNHKVSLMALDFMNLSCGPEVYWTRSRVSGGVQTQESRFLSRVVVARGRFDTDVASDILTAVRSRDVVEFNPLCYANPQPPADWKDVYVTRLELLIHNPYAFYVQNILRLRRMNDYWVGADVRDFGTLVHSVLEVAPTNATEQWLVAEMDRRAIDALGRQNLIFYFWHRRFMEIAPVALQMLRETDGALVEIEGVVNIAGRNVRARADRIWDGGVLDIKTGAAPSKKQLADGTMPQLPLEAYMLQKHGFRFRTTVKSETPIMQFLQLKSGDARIINFDVEETATAINAAYSKVKELFNMYSAGGAEYEYRRTGEQKYQEYDDFARADERD
ncbi:MAG: PD-(D/E)XK nuclease family protein [Alphaproteobacteria bacterium]|nr:PD-(D/E)XK nuclease family protein [Alphaproteobacteria bacterium]